MTWARRLYLFITAMLWGGMIALTLGALFPAQAADTITSTTSTVTVDKTPPTASAPSVMINNSDVCRYSSSGAVQSTVIGIAAGGSAVDEMCEQLKLSRRLYSSGMKVASIALICQDARVFKAMWNAGTYCPYHGLIGEAAKKGWLANEKQLPEGVGINDLLDDFEYYEHYGVTRYEAKTDCADRGYTFSGDPCRNN